MLWNLPLEGIVYFLAILVIVLEVNRISKKIKHFRIGVFYRAIFAKVGKLYSEDKISFYLVREYPTADNLIVDKIWIVRGETPVAALLNLKDQGIEFPKKIQMIKLKRKIDAIIISEEIKQPKIYFDIVIVSVDSEYQLCTYENSDSSDMALTQAEIAETIQKVEAAALI